MRLTTEKEMACLVRSCLPEMDEIEPAFIQECCLRGPTVTPATFAKRWRLSPMDLSEIRTRTMQWLRKVFSNKGIYSIGDIV